ncbi:hypothetical protein [Cupriavidus taiwanensis]|uniref:Uncharacterized protein n=1 Tax=Cupriavidus taiwanensis TaxID=164546 RepID=A0A375JBN0_9BURK|nr:hypothetical protein [Cupriavidus taiwanensis]SPS02595.1 hypothetical protein CBM2634_U190008 [Cupriavidus taiwanensis]
MINIKFSEHSTPVFPALWSRKAWQLCLRAACGLTDLLGFGRICNGMHSVLHEYKLLSGTAAVAAVFEY